MTLIKNKVLQIWKKTACGNSSHSDISIGTITMYLGSSAPDSWLLCDGGVFDRTVYTELYNILGTNVLPDLRECTTKGAGQNTNGTIHNTVALGAFQNDTVKSHSHTMSHTHTRGSMNITGQCGGYVLDGNQSGSSGALFVSDYGNEQNMSITGSGTAVVYRGRYNLNAANGWSGSTSGPSNANTGTSGSGGTSEAKAVGVNYIIKAR